MHYCKRFSLAFFAVFLTVVSCTSAPSTIPSTAQTPSPIAKVATNSPVPSPIIGTLTLTPTHFSSPTVTATPPLIPTDLQWKLDRTTYSPDKAWIAQSFYETSRKTDWMESPYTKLLIKKVDHSIEWERVVVFPYFNDPPVSMMSPQVVLWSKDGRFVYYVSQFFISGCILFQSGSGMERLDLTTGETQEILSPRTFYPEGTAMAISPDGRTLAYIADFVDSNKFVLRDWETGQEKTILIETGTTAHDVIGNIVWSPDGSLLAFTIMYNPCQPVENPPDVSTSIMLMDVSSLRTEFIRQNDPKLHVTQKWLDQHTLFLTNLPGNFPEKLDVSAIISKLKTQR